jgi:putative SOS response-associated peptidase YedK
MVLSDTVGVCARYTVVTPADELIEEFEATLTVDSLRPHSTLAPTDVAPVGIASREGERRLGLARFGFIPHWAKDARQGVKMLNARSETVATKPAFRAAFAKYRCLVVADGFYEWQREGKAKIPHRYHLGGAPFGLAGLWSTWRGAADEKVSSFTILTRDAVGAPARIHHRMPILLPREAYGAWLDREVSDPEQLGALLERHRGEELLETRVSERVNSVRNDDPTLIDPVA